MGNHSLAEYPNECVGLILKTGEYVRSTNISTNPKTTFYLDPADLVKYDGQIWGIFHSHPGDTNPIPSIEDKTSAAFNEYKFLVGFANKIFIYWLDKNVDALRFEPFKESHIENMD